MGPFFSSNGGQEPHSAGAFFPEQPHCISTLPLRALLVDGFDLVEDVLSRVLEEVLHNNLEIVSNCLENFLQAFQHQFADPPIAVLYELGDFLDEFLVVLGEPGVLLRSRERSPQRPD